jgi:hypothetical protein
MLRAVTRPTGPTFAASPGATLARAGLLTAVIDFLFASTLSVVAYRSTFSRLWQGVASVPLGPKAMEGGTTMVLAGLLLHVLVAFTWSAVFVFALLRMGWVRRLLASRHGVLKVAALYGPLIWLVMSLAVIPAFAGRPPRISYRWLVQLLGHIPFVAVPIAFVGRKSLSA